MDRGNTRRTLRDFLHIVFKRKTQMLLFFAATLLTAALGLLVMNPTYEATARLLIKVGRENLYVPPMAAGGGSPVIRLNPEEQINSEIEILLSRHLAEQVVERLGPGVLYPDSHDRSQGFLGGLFGGGATTGSPVERAAMRLLENLSAEAVRKSDVIAVSFRHKDPSMAARVVSLLVSLHLDRHLEVFKSPQAYEFFREQSRLLKEKLMEAEDNLARFKDDSNLTVVEEQRLLLVRNEAALRVALDQASSQEAETERRLRQLREQGAQTPETISLAEEIDHNPHAVSALKARLVDLELREHELLVKYKEQNHWVQGVRSEIRTVRNTLAEQEAARYGRTRSGVNPIYQTLQQEILRNEAELKALTARKETQKAQLAAYQRQMERFNPVELEFNRLQQELEVYRQNYRLYLSRFEEARILDAMDQERITNVSVIEPAKTPIEPVSPKAPLILVLAVLFGGVGAVGLALLSEYLDDSLEKAEDVETLLHLPVLASIPEQRT